MGKVFYGLPVLPVWFPAPSGALPVFSPFDGRTSPMLFRPVAFKSGAFPLHIIGGRSAALGWRSGVRRCPAPAVAFKPGSYPEPPRLNTPGSPRQPAERPGWPPSARHALTRVGSSELIKVLRVSSCLLVVGQGCLALGSHPPISAFPHGNLHMIGLPVDRQAVVCLGPPRHRP